MNPLAWLALLILGLAAVALAYEALTERKDGSGSRRPAYSWT
jgi:hypothetical protein